jgi:pilus assembly protein Flp/PilA
MEERFMSSFWQSLMADESGQGLVEYALIIALVSIGLIVALGLLRGKISTIFGKIGTTLDAAGPVGPS